MQPQVAKLTQISINDEPEKHNKTSLPCIHQHRSITHLSTRKVTQPLSNSIASFRNLDVQAVNKVRRYNNQDISIQVPPNALDCMNYASNTNSPLKRLSRSSSMQKELVFSNQMDRSPNRVHIVRAFTNNYEEQSPNKRHNSIAAIRADSLSRHSMRLNSNGIFLDMASPISYMRKRLVSDANILVKIKQSEKYRPLQLFFNQISDFNPPNFRPHTESMQARLSKEELNSPSAKNKIVCLPVVDKIQEKQINISDLFLNSDNNIGELDQAIPSHPHSPIVEQP